MCRSGAEDLVGRYCDAVLRNDPEIFASTWRIDGVWVIPGRGEVTGRSDIVDTFTSLRRNYQLCVQQVLNGTVTPIDDQHATASWQVRELRWLPGGEGSELIGVYHDVLDGSSPEGWQFARRRFELIYDGGVDLPGRIRGPR
jgi:uncharacterized protein (TIGR02246 family)